MEFVVIAAASIVLPDGVEQSLTPGMLVSDQDPTWKYIVKRYPDYFYAPNVEQMTAAPGEVRRGPGRPRKII